MVAAVWHLVKASNSMRCFIKGSVVSPVVQFCDHSEDKNDSGDGAGIPVFSFFAISLFENLAQEIVEMFVLELNLKRLLVLKLVSTCEEAVGGQIDILNWSHELYPGEYDDLRMNNLLSQECCQLLPPQIKDWESSNPLSRKSNHPSSREVLQIHELDDGLVQLSEGNQYPAIHPFYCSSGSSFPKRCLFDKNNSVAQ